MKKNANVRRTTNYGRVSQRSYRTGKKARYAATVRLENIGPCDKNKKVSYLRQHYATCRSWRTLLVAEQQLLLADSHETISEDEPITKMLQPEIGQGLLQMRRAICRSNSFLYRFFFLSSHFFSIFFKQTVFLKRFSDVIRAWIE